MTDHAPKDDVTLYEKEADALGGVYEAVALDRLIARLRLGGPNAMEVSDEAADELTRLSAELAEKERVARDLANSRRDWMCRAEAAEAARVKLEAELAEYKRRFDRPSPQMPCTVQLSETEVFPIYSDFHTFISAVLAKLAKLEADNAQRVFVPPSL